MKFPPENANNSFYESFSDLIFATMAIFVLIVIVLMVQIRPTKENVVEKNPLELIIAVDGSGSMAGPMERLKRAVNSVVEAIPLVTTEFRIGIVIYRNNLDVFPLSSVFPSEKDQSRSLNAVKNFTNQFEAQSSRIAFEKAINKSLDMFSGAEARKSLMVLGDRGPFEITNACPSPSVESRILNKVRNFSANNNGLRVYTMFSQSQATCNSETVSFFKRLASAGSSDGRYTDDTSKLLVMLLQASLGK